MSRQVSPESSSAYPHVLFLGSEPPHLAGAGSIFFNRLFQEYPPENLLVISHRQPPTGVEKLACRYESLPLPFDRLQKTRFWKWRSRLRVLGAVNLIPLNRIWKRLGRFCPDVVVTLMQDGWMYELAARVAKRLKCPLVVFVHDLAHGFEPAGAMLQSRQLARDKQFLLQARHRFFVSPGMAAFFHDQLGIDGEVLLPPRSPQAVSQPPEACRTLKVSDTLSLGYSGGLHYGYGEQLLAMLPVLREAGCHLHLVGPPPAGRVAQLAEATDVVTVHGHQATPEQAWELLLKKCDVNLLPYLNPPGGHDLQYQTHFPSKLGDCLALGLPLLATGPENSSGIRWLLGHPGASICVTDPSPSVLRQALYRLKEDATLRLETAGKAQGCACEFDAVEKQRSLYRMLQSL